MTESKIVFSKTRFDFNFPEKDYKIYRGNLANPLNAVFVIEYEKSSCPSRVVDGVKHKSYYSNNSWVEIGKYKFGTRRYTIRSVPVKGGDVLNSLRKIEECALGKEELAKTLLDEVESIAKFIKDYALMRYRKGHLDNLYNERMDKMLFALKLIERLEKL